MSRHQYYSDSGLAAMLSSLVGVWRHHPDICRPGLYRVAFYVDWQWGVRNADAVCDDFGNLVRVSA